MPCMVGYSSGASAPDILVQQVIARLRELGALSVRTLDGVRESVRFPLPRGLGERSPGEREGAASALHATRP